jgi:S1-C subfamily serine protease
MWEARGPRYPIESVVPGSAADRAGIRSGDVIVRINHVEPKDLAQVRRLLAGRGSKTAFVELARGHRRIGVLVF